MRTREQILESEGELINRVVELEAALRDIATEMEGAHDGACVFPVQEILRRIFPKFGHK